MTNTIFIRPVYVDESSVEGSSETLSAAGHDDDENGGAAGVSRTMYRSDAKGAMLLGIRMNCFARPASSDEEEEEEDKEAEEDDKDSTLAVLGSVEDNNGENQREEDHKALLDETETSMSLQNPLNNNLSNNLFGEQVTAGWPSWLSSFPSEAIHSWIPRPVNTFQILYKIGHGARCNVCEARDLWSGKIVALKRFLLDRMNPDKGVRIITREILILRRLDHPNVIKLQGLAICELSFSLYLVFERMENEFACSPPIWTRLTEPEIKCYMHQLLSGLEHCHRHGVLHRNMNFSNLLLDNGGILKIAGFGSASFLPPMKSIISSLNTKLDTLWYQAPELLMETTVYYGVGVDLWSSGCILAELCSGNPIMCGSTKEEQLDKIFKLCGSPSEEYWINSKFSNPLVNRFKPLRSYKRRTAVTFNKFPPSSLPLIETLLAIEPDERQTATAALRSEFFTAKPYACEPSGLQRIAFVGLWITEFIFISCLYWLIFSMIRRSSSP